MSQQLKGSRVWGLTRPSVNPRKRVELGWAGMSYSSLQHTWSCDDTDMRNTTSLYLSVKLHWFRGHFYPKQLTCVEYRGVFELNESAAGFWFRGVWGCFRTDHNDWVLWSSTPASREKIINLYTLLFVKKKNVLMSCRWYAINPHKRNIWNLCCKLWARLSNDFKEQGSVLMCVHCCRDVVIHTPTWCFNVTRLSVVCPFRSLYSTTLKLVLAKGYYLQ